MERFAPEGLFLFAATAHLLLIAYTVFRMSRRARPAQTMRETFRGLPLPKTVTPESATLDPRGEEAADPGTSAAGD
jgi:hypothetical protein